MLINQTCPYVLFEFREMKDVFSNIWFEKDIIFGRFWFFKCCLILRNYKLVFFFYFFHSDLLVILLWT